MGTRSLTVVLSEPVPLDDLTPRKKYKHEICVMYRQMDGYISAHGHDLAEFLKPITLCNGLSSTDIGYWRKANAIHAWFVKGAKLANGMDCLAAQLVAHFKKDAGSIYLYRAGTRDAGEEYIYFIHPSGDPFSPPCRILVTCFAGYDKKWKLLFHGYTPDQLLSYKEPTEST